MAVVFLFRVAIKIAPYTWRIIASAQPTTAWLLQQSIRDYWSSILDPFTADLTLSEAMSAQAGYSVNVTTWTTELDLRKLQVRYSRAPTGGTVEDVAVTTHTFLKVTAGTPDSVWTDPTNYASVETAYNAFWNSLKPFYPSYVKLDQYRWYLDNSALRLADHAPNPALRVTEVDVAGEVSSGSLPPQVSLSVTEVTAARKSWGRFYLPAMSAAHADAGGRFNSVSTWLPYVVTFYNACRSAGLVPVVFAPGLPARSSAAARRAAAAVGPGTAPDEDIPARASAIYEVTHVQMDNLFDVIRSRRWDAPTTRTRTAVT